MTDALIQTDLRLGILYCPETDSHKIVHGYSSSSALPSQQVKIRPTPSTVVNNALESLTDNESISNHRIDIWANMVLSDDKKRVLGSIFCLFPSELDTFFAEARYGATIGEICLGLVKKPVYVSKADAVVLKMYGAAISEIQR